MNRFLIMNWPFFKMALTAFVLVSYLVLWYLDEMIPAWQAAIWVAMAYLGDLGEYLDYRLK
jgi:hypothetical protein